MPVCVALCAFSDHDCSGVDMHGIQASVFEIIQWHSNFLNIAASSFICFWYCSGARLTQGAKEKNKLNSTPVIKFHVNVLSCVCSELLHFILFIVLESGRINSGSRRALSHGSF